MAKPVTHTVQIIGDGMDGRWITWRWSEALFPAGIAKTEGLNEAAAAFKAVLPQGIDEAALRKSLRSGLAVPTAEAGIMRALSRALLPTKLRAEIRQCHDSGARLIVRVAPPPQAAAVPWGLLFLDDELRLLDVADIAWLAPVLLRDLGHPSAPATATPDAAAGSRPLHIIDPELGNEKQLFDDLSDVTAFIDGASVAERRKVTRNDLSEALHESPTRFYFLGHCSARGTQSDSMGMVLSDEHGDTQHPLTAGALMNDPSRWPMPSRAALVACASGIDMADFEPFGLATALLNNGASLVQAALWVLPTDHALKALGQARRRPFLSLACAIDAAQCAYDPVAHLNAWQRARLAEWRAAPPDKLSIDDSPLLWGAAMTMIAPSRQLTRDGPLAHHTVGTTAQR